MRIGGVSAGKGAQRDPDDVSALGQRAVEVARAAR